MIEETVIIAVPLNQWERWQTLRAQVHALAQVRTGEDLWRACEETSRLYNELADDLLILLEEQDLSEEVAR